MYSPHITKANLFETSGHLDWFADGHVPADACSTRAARRHQVLPQADELPVPHPDLQEPRAFATASCRCGSSSSARSTATSGRASCTGSRACAGMTQDDAHIFCTKEQMADELRVAARLRARAAARLRPRRLLSRAVDASPRARRSAPSRSGRRRPRRCAQRRDGDGSRPRPRRGRRRVLRPEDLGAGARRDRSDVAGLDDPGRLPAPAALRACSTSAPTTSATGRS